MLPSWPYHFVTLSPAQLQRRRELLDLRGYYAQCSAIIGVVAIRLYQSYKGKARGSDGQNRGKNHPIPRQGQRSWWDMPPCRGWRETRKQYLVAFIWLGWLLSVSVWGTGDDYLHPTKALGHVAISQLPFQTLMSPVSYLSTTKPNSPAVLSHVTSIPQQTLIHYHRLFGRLVLAPLLLGHAAMYLSFFLQSSHPDFGSLLAKRIGDRDVQWGLAALSTAISILLFTRPSGGQKKEKGNLRMSAAGSWDSSSTRTKRWVFYIGHVSLVVAFCVAVYFHVGYTGVYVLETLGAFVLNMAYNYLLA